MKKAITAFIIATLALCLVLGIAACDSKSDTVRALIITAADGLDYSDYNLGDFYYKKSVDESGAYPDFSTLNFKVQYEDGSTAPLAADSPELKVVEISKDGTVVTDAPVLYDVGVWTYVYEYRGAKANVYFNIMPASNAEYQITGLPSSWVYSTRKDLTETIAVSGYPSPVVFSGEDTNALVYYISADYFDEHFAGATVNEQTMSDIVFASRLYYPYAQSGYFVPAGEYYFFLKMSATGNYSDQLTNLQKVTVEKETFDIGTLPTLNESYKFYSSNGPGNVKISEALSCPYYSFTTTNKGGETIKLITAGWMDPDDEISVGTPDKKYKVKLAPDTSFDNYNMDNLYIECTVTATAGYMQSDYSTFAFGDEEQLVVNRDVQLNECTQKGLKFFTALGLDNNDALLESYFKMVSVTDKNGKKLSVYAENSETPLFAGDDGAIGKIVRTTSGSVYDYRIILNENALGDYTFTVSLIDDVNFYWGTVDNNYGTEPIILNYSVVENDPNGYMNVITSYVTDGTITIELELDEAAYDPALLDTLKITRDESYTFSDHVFYSDENVTIDADNVQVSESETYGGRVKLTVTLPVTIPDDSDFHYLCLSITMQTADTYADVNESTYAYLQLI